MWFTCSCFLEVLQRHQTADAIPPTSQVLSSWCGKDTGELFGQLPQTRKSLSFSGVAGLFQSNMEIVNIIFWISSQISLFFWWITKLWVMIIQSLKLCLQGVSAFDFRCVGNVDDKQFMQYSHWLLATQVLVRHVVFSFFLPMCTTIAALSIKCCDNHLFF